MTLILASNSAARMAMLAAAGVAFQASPAQIDEDQLRIAWYAKNMSALALALAEAKAASVAGFHPDALILGCDQTLELNTGAGLNKPSSLPELSAQLRTLSGQTHHLHSAAAIWARGNVCWRGCESVSLTMRPLSAQFIDDYVKNHGANVLQSVGGYHIEGVGIQLFERIEGSHFAIMGLPLLPLLVFLREHGELLS